MSLFTPLPRVCRPKTGVRPSRTGRRQQGFAVVAAIFIIVAGAAISAVVVTANQAYTRGQTADWLAVQAYHAARSGVEWGLWKVTNAATKACDANTTLSPAEWNGRFTVALTCTFSDHEEDNGSGTDVALGIYTVTATACNTTPCPGTPGPNYVERQLRLTFESQSLTPP